MIFLYTLFLLRWKEIKGFTLFLFDILMAFLWISPLEVRLFILSHSLMIALDMFMFILFQNTSRNDLLCLSHVILKWKIS